MWYLPYSHVCMILHLTGWAHTPHLYSRELTGLMIDQMPVHVSRDENQHLIGKWVFTCCWTACLHPGWEFQTGSGFRVRNFPVHKHNVFSWCNLQFLSYGLCFGVVLSLGVCFLVTLCMLSMALIYLRKQQYLGLVDFPYDGSFVVVSSFYSCNSSMWPAI